MAKSKLLVVSMAEQCTSIILKSNMCNWELPYTLQPKHLLWMCDEVANHARDWPAEKLHRWIGFVQCGLLANNILNLDEAKLMLAHAIEYYGPQDAEIDLIDHLESNDSYTVDIGSER